jgi:hypothetical protein
MTLSKKLKPFMTYMDDHDYVKLKRFAKSKKVTMARVLREGLIMRMAEENPYMAGFNDGLDKAMGLMSANTAAQMRFPSGKSFAEIMTDEIMQHRIREVPHETA